MITIAALAMAVTTAAETPPSLSLLVWGDLRGDPSPKLFSWVDSLRRQAEEMDQPLLALDAGGTFFGSDLAFLTGGISQAKILNLVAPDAITLGASDFWWDRPHLDSALAITQVPVVTSNILYAIDDKPYGGKSLALWDFGDLRVGLIGVANPDLEAADRPSKAYDLRANDPAEYVQAALDQLKAQKTDVVVVLSHAGRESDLALAQAVEGIDLIVGSRGEVASEPERVGRTWIVRTAAGENKLTRIDWTRTEFGGKVASAPSLPPSTINLPADWKPLYDSLSGLLKARADEVIATTKEAWPKTSREGRLGNFLADALRAGAGTEIAFWPASSILAGLPRGKVTIGDLWKTIPPPQQVSVFDLPGSDLERLVLRQMTQPKDFLFLSGATCSPDSSRFGGPPLRVLVDGKPLQPSDRYKIAIPLSIRDRIYDLMGLSLASAGPIYLERWDRDMIEKYARENQFHTTLGRVPAMYGVFH